MKGTSGHLCRLLLIPLLGSCRSGETAPAPAPLSFHVVTSYPAALTYVLDGVAGRPHHHPGYRPWLVPENRGTPWLTSFQTHRPRFSQQIDRGLGAFEPYLLCSYQASSLDDLWRRWQAIIPDESMTTLRTAVEEMDRRLRPRWPHLAKSLERGRQEIMSLLQSSQGAELLDELSRRSGVARREFPEFTIVLVPRPSGSTLYAQHQGSTLVVEWSPEGSWAGRMGALFHELAHLVLRAGGRVAQVQADLDGGSRESFLAAAFWNESFCTAYGNLWVPTQLGEPPPPHVPLYDHPAIDALARGFDAQPSKFDEPLRPSWAEAWVTLVEDLWPEERWRMGDLFFHQRAHAWDEASMRVLATGLGSAHLEGVLRPQRGFSEDRVPALPQVSLLALTTGHRQPQVWKHLPVSRQEAQARLDQADQAFWFDWSAGKPPQLLILARDLAGLRSAAAKVRAQRRVPDNGWFRP